MVTASNQSLDLTSCLYTFAFVLLLFFFDACSLLLAPFCLFLLNQVRGRKRANERKRKKIVDDADDEEMCARKARDSRKREREREKEKRRGRASGKQVDCKIHHLPH